MAFGYIPLQRVHLGLEHQVNRFMGCDYNIERFFNRIKQFRRLATRYEKLAQNFLSMLHPVVVKKDVAFSCRFLRVSRLLLGG